MKPIAVFQFSPNVEPGYFASFLADRGIPFCLYNIGTEDAIPDTPTDFCGICLMGGVMSVNDPLPWIPLVLELIRQAVKTGIPVIGHCLGGQLLSKALGGTITRNSTPEIGWGNILVADNDCARDWLGNIVSFPGFHWHGDTFSLPKGASPLLSSHFCANQGFAIGPHLGMQCHVEMTEALIRTWNNAWADDTASREIASVQSTADQLAQMAEHLPQMRAVAQRLYERWLENVRQS